MSAVKCNCDFLPSGGMEWNPKCPLHGKRGTHSLQRPCSAVRPVKLDKEGLPVRAEDWLLEDWRDLWNGIERIKAKIRKRHAAQQNEKGQR